MWGGAGIWSRAGQARLCQARPGQDRADGRTGLEGGQSGADYRIQVTKKSSHVTILLHACRYACFTVLDILCAEDWSLIGVTFAITYQYGNSKYDLEPVWRGHVSCCSYSDLPQPRGVSLSLSMLESRSWPVVQTKAIQVANVWGPI